MALHRPATPTAGLGQHRCRAAFHGASGQGRRRGCGQAGCFPQLRLLQPPAHALGPGRRRPGRPGSSHLGALKSTEFTTCHPAAITIVTTSRQRKAKQNLSETAAAPARRPLRKGGSAGAVCSPELGGTRAPQSQVPRRSPPWAQHRARAPGQGLSVTGNGSVGTRGVLCWSGALLPDLSRDLGRPCGLASLPRACPLVCPLVCPRLGRGPNSDTE